MLTAIKALKNIIILFGIMFSAYAYAVEDISTKVNEVHYRVISAQQLPAHIVKKISKALMLIGSQPPASMNQVRLVLEPPATRDEDVNKNLDIDIIVQIMSAEELRNEFIGWDTLRELAGFVQLGTRRSGTIIENPVSTGPILVYLGWDSLVAVEDTYGADVMNLRSDSLTQLTLALVKELYGNALFLHNLKAERKDYHTQNLKPLTLNFEQRVRQTITTLRETVQFIDRIVEHESEQLTRDEYQSFIYQKLNLLTQIKTISRLLPPEKMSAKIISFDVARKCREQLSKD